MLQVIELNTQLKEHIVQLENDCEHVCKQLEKKYADEFKNLGVKITVEFLRTTKGSLVEQTHVFEENYHSFVEIGVIEEDEYFPNTYIPIWKCKREMFQLVGYLTREDVHGIERKAELILEEMLQDWFEEMKSYK